jgi:hypothetical protein
MNEQEYSEELGRISRRTRVVKRPVIRWCCPVCEKEVLSLTAKQSQSLAVQHLVVHLDRDTMGEPEG